MLIGKNQRQVVFLNQWSSLEELQQTEIFPPTGPNTEAGICLIRQSGNKAIAGVYYKTASEREILQTPDIIYLRNMDESQYFRAELEQYFGTEFELTDNDIEYHSFTVDRPIDKRDLEGLSVPIWNAGYLRTYTVDAEKNKMIFEIFNHVIQKWPDALVVPFQKDLKSVYTFLKGLQRNREINTRRSIGMEL